MTIGTVRKKLKNPMAANPCPPKTNRSKEIFNPRKIP